MSYINCEKEINIQNICRCCGTYVESEPLLCYKKMPAKAQNFPSYAELETDLGIDLEVYQCQNCGLIQIFSEPVEYYRDVIRAIGVSEDMREFRRSYFADFVQQYGLQGKRIIEIGAGCGEYMELLGEQSIDVYGLENLPSSVESARKKGLSVFKGFIESAETVIPGSPYDGFLVMNFLEHIPDPKEFLKGIAANIIDDSYGLIEVPNGDYIIDNRMFSEFMLDHLCYFTQSSLKNLLNICGFEVVECKVIWNNYIIAAIVKKRKQVEISAFTQEQDKLVSAIEAYVKRKKEEGKKIAVWGAGHQALAVMALADLKGKIECVIDSASFKQNRFTPATHIPIHAPEKISELGIDAILVIAGSYSTEVCNLIRNDYENVEVATLTSLVEMYEE